MGSIFVLYLDYFLFFLNIKTTPITTNIRPNICAPGLSSYPPNMNKNIPNKIDKIFKVEYKIFFILV